jgi:hypothetical protein
VRKIILKTYDFVGISNTVIPTTLEGSTIASPPIMIVILRQLDYLYIVDYSRADHATPDKKLSFSLPRIEYYLLSPPPILGGFAMKNHPAYH